MSKRLPGYLEKEEIGWENLRKMKPEDLVRLHKDIRKEIADLGKMARPLYDTVTKCQEELKPLESRLSRLDDERQSIWSALWGQFGWTNPGTEERGNLEVTKEERKRACDYYYKGSREEVE